MSTSRNHRLVALTEEQVVNYKRLGWDCTRKCGQPAAARAEFEFVTGRTGRIGTRSSRVCAVHAQKFADQHRIFNPVIDPAFQKAAAEVAGWNRTGYGSDSHRGADGTWFHQPADRRTEALRLRRRANRIARLAYVLYAADATRRAQRRATFDYVIRSLNPTPDEQAYVGIAEAN